MTPTPRQRRRLPRRSQRGAALLMAVVSVAMLTALAVDLAYETQVRLRIAGNARDELRAQGLAQSAVTMSRLVLAMQQQVDGMCTALPLKGAAVGTAVPGIPCPQVWNIFPVSSSSGLTQSLFADGDGPVAGAKAPAAAKPAPSKKTDAPGAPALQTASLAGVQGGFEASIQDEEQKINAQLDIGYAGGVLQTEVESLLRMMCDSKWDPLFDRTDADGQRYSRSDLVVNLRDWVDDDATASGLTASFAGGNCSPVVGQNPFEKGFADENVPYDRGTDRYRTKNARFDSLEELHLVAGITDAFMAAFGDQLTVYMRQNPRMNVNATDPRLQVWLFQTVADDATRGKLADPKILDALLKYLNIATGGGLLRIPVDQWLQALKGVAGVNPQAIFTGSSSPLTDSSVIYSIHAKGVAGDVTHEIDAVVSYDPAMLPPEEQANTRGGGMGGGSTRLTQGALIHWHED